MIFCPGGGVQQSSFCSWQTCKRSECTGWRREPWSAARLLYLFLEKWAVSTHSHRTTELEGSRTHHASQIFLPKYLKGKGRWTQTPSARRQVMFAKWHQIQWRDVWVPIWEAWIWMRNPKARPRAQSSWGLMEVRTWNEAGPGLNVGSEFCLGPGFSLGSGVNHRSGLELSGTRIVWS